MSFRLLEIVSDKNLSFKPYTFEIFLVTSWPQLTSLVAYDVLVCSPSFSAQIETS